MNSTYTTDIYEIRQIKKRFWINWVIANASGMAIGWCLGEYVGQLVLSRYGIRSGSIIAAIIFEVSIWASRLLVSEYTKKQRAIKFIDGLIWFSTEICGWIAFSFTKPEGKNLTAEVIFIFSMGVVFWIIFALWGLLRARKIGTSPEWLSQVFIYTLLGFGLGNMFVVFLLTTAMSIENSLGKVFDPYIGRGAAGIFLGGAFGMITGLILTKIIDWKKNIEKNTIYK